MKRSALCLALLAATVIPTHALAQRGGGGGGGGFGGGGPGGAPGGAPRGAPGQVDAITVTGQSQGFRSSIDRRSYNVLEDLQTSTGSIGDALRNVPAVQVDVQGNVTIRGDTVTILVDGRPSALFRGDQAAGIQTFPADQIERVEVITNPSASMSSEGSGGIINLVTRQTFRGGYSGSLRGNFGTQGNWNGGLNAAYQSGKVVASASGNVRHENRKTETVDQRTRIDPVAGTEADSSSRSTSRSTNDNQFLRAGVDYDTSETMRFGFETSYRKSSNESASFDHQESENSAGVLSRIIDRANLNSSSGESIEAEGSFRKRFTGDQHELVGEISREWSDDSRTRNSTNTSLLPATGAAFETFDFAGQEMQTQVRLDYNRPVGEDQRLKVGYLLNLDRNSEDNLGLRGAALGALTADPSQTYHLSYRQEVHAAYLTYEKPFGYLTVLPGIRLEQAEVDISVPTQGVSGANSYLRAYPSLHLTYDLSETQRLSASYSMRIQRPRANDLNPFRVYVDPFNFRQGNPNLRPQETKSIEVGWQMRSGQTFYLATAYYRHSEGGVTDVVRDIGGGVFLTTRENLNTSRSGGLELVANGRLLSNLSYNVSGNLFWNEIDASSLGFSEKRSAASVSGRVNLNWQATANDFFQINGFASGKRLNAQGYSTGFAVVNLGYRRKLTDRLSLIATAQDVLGTARQRTVYDTARLQGSRRSESSQRGGFIGFSWAFGAVQRNQRAEGFEFGGEGEGAP